MRRFTNYREHRERGLGRRPWNQNGIQKLYINGVENITGTYAGGIVINDNSTSSESVIGERDFEGSIDDVRIYNRVLSGAEIQGLYNGGQ